MNLNNNKFLKEFIINLKFKGFRTLDFAVRLGDSQYSIN